MTIKTNNKTKVGIFLSLTFVATWVSWWLLSVIKQDDTQVFSNPIYFLLFFIGGIAPTIVAYLTIKYTDKDFKKFNKSVFKINMDTTVLTMPAISVKQCQ